MAEHDADAAPRETALCQLTPSATWPSSCPSSRIHRRRGSKSPGLLAAPSHKLQPRSQSEPDCCRAEGQSGGGGSAEGFEGLEGSENQDVSRAKEGHAGHDEHDGHDGAHAEVENGPLALVLADSDIVPDSDEKKDKGGGPTGTVVRAAPGGRRTPKTGSIRRTFGRAIPQLPRQPTLKRQQSEKRNNLAPFQPTQAERRALSADRRSHLGGVSPNIGAPQPLSLRSSAPDMSSAYMDQASAPNGGRLNEEGQAQPQEGQASVWRRGQRQGLPGGRRGRRQGLWRELERGEEGSGFEGLGGLRAAHSHVKDGCLFVTPSTPADEPPPLGWLADPEIEEASEDGYLQVQDDDSMAYDGDGIGIAAGGLSAPSDVDTQSITSSQWAGLIAEELDKKWILNLSMHFRDKSKREKFFVTYRERNDTWRRVTVSLDYRDVAENSLEGDLSRTSYQRDKSAKIYEAIRDSLADIKFYDTVTNLKLQTTEGRLHVHVMEDSNEIIRYPSVRQVQHLGCRRIRESNVVFESHMSGFVYKVRVDGRTLIKKEIPGPDTIEEFLYEINALTRLEFSQHVIRFHGLVVDDEDEHVKGLLISYAARGPLIDVIFDHGREHKPDLAWPTREKWASQIIHGLADVHESGFVQGDFTLSNIVVDEHGDAKIIDINRRGCPVGWEPPEATALTESNQRISMYIGVKSDLYQLGMVLWALAMQVDEPENVRRPLRLPSDADDIPRWYRRVVGSCLSSDPRRRLHACQLLALIPEEVRDRGWGRDQGWEDQELFEEVIIPHAPMAPPAAEYTGARAASDSDADGSSSSCDGTSRYSNGTTNNSRGTYNGVDDRTKPASHPSTYPGAYPYPFVASHYPAPGSRSGSDIASDGNPTALPFDSFMFARGRSPTSRIPSHGPRRQRDYSALASSGGGDEDDDDKLGPRGLVYSEVDDSDDGDSGHDDSDAGDGNVEGSIYGSSDDGDGNDGDSDDGRSSNGNSNADENGIGSSHNRDSDAAALPRLGENPGPAPGTETGADEAPTLSEQPPPFPARSIDLKIIDKPWVVHTLAGLGRPCSDPGAPDPKEHALDTQCFADLHGFQDMSGVLFGIRMFEEWAPPVRQGRGLNSATDLHFDDAIGTLDTGPTTDISTNDDGVHHHDHHCQYNHTHTP